MAWKSLLPRRHGHATAGGWRKSKSFTLRGINDTVLYDEKAGQKQDLVFPKLLPDYKRALRRQVGQYCRREGYR